MCFFAKVLLITYICILVVVAIATLIIIYIHIASVSAADVVAVDVIVAVAVATNINITESYDSGAGFIVDPYPCIFFFHFQILGWFVMTVLIDVVYIVLVSRRISSTPIAWFDVR